MATVKKSICRKIIKMTLTEEKHYWNFHVWLFLAEMRLNVLGMCMMYKAVCVLLSLTSSRGTSIVTDVKLVLSH